MSDDICSLGEKKKHRQRTELCVSSATHADETAEKKEEKTEFYEMSMTLSTWMSIEERR